MNIFISFSTTQTLCLCICFCSCFCFCFVCRQFGFVHSSFIPAMNFAPSCLCSLSLSLLSTSISILFHSVYARFICLYRSESSRKSSSKRNRTHDDPLPLRSFPMFVFVFASVCFCCTSIRLEFITIRLNRFRVNDSNFAANRQCQSPRNRTKESFAWMRTTWLR